MKKEIAGKILFTFLLLTVSSSLGTFQSAGIIYAQEEGPLTVLAFKGTYSIGMTVTVFGEVTESFNPGSTVSVKVSNPIGQTYQDVQAALNEGGSFSIDFVLEGPTASVLGAHAVEVEYRSLQASTSFEVKEAAVLTLNVLKDTFDLGEEVQVTGTVTPRLVDPVEIKIYNPDNAIWKFVAVAPNRISADGGFSINVGELSGKLSVPGKYRVEASYADNTASAMLEFDVKVTGKVTPGRFTLVDSTGQPLEEVFVGQQVLVQADIRNNLAEKLPFSYFVLITDSDGFTVLISWLTGTLPESETLSAAQSWVPAGEGSFNVKVFVWKSVSEPEILGKSLERNVTVSV